jgi:hypothetical protein
LPDIELAQTFARPDVLRVNLQQPLIALNGVFGFALKLVNQSQIHQYRFRFRIKLQGFAITLFGGEIEFAFGPDPSQIVVT